MKKNKIFSKVLNTIIIAVTAVFCGFMIYVTVSTAKGNTVNIFGKSVLRIVTGSMEPSIHVGDCIVVEKVDSSELKKGDIIAFVSVQPDIYGIIVTHRIYGTDENGNFITKGDANPTADSTEVSADRIIGKYIGKAKVFRWLYSFGDLRKVVLLVIMSVMTCISFYETKTLIRAGKELHEEEQDELYEKLMREAIEKEKKRLAEENYKPDSEVKKN